MADIAPEDRSVEIRPFSIAVPEPGLDDLIGRLRNTPWPVGVATEWSRGVPAPDARRLAAYWAGTFDWRAQEARLKEFPQFTTVVDGQAIHFVHVRSANPDATPLLLLHGYPSSFVEAIRMIGPLVDPESHGGRAEDAFHVVVPSLPGFGFSTPVAGGWAITESASAFDGIMQALRYDRHGGSSGGSRGRGGAE